MDASRISFGELVAGASGVLLFLVMFFPWYGVEVGLLAGSASENANAWEAFDYIDIILLLVVLMAVGMAAARAAGAMPTALPAPPGLIVAGAGALAVLLILFRIIEIPGPGIDIEGVDLSREVGIFLGLIAALGIAFGGYTTMNERAEGAPLA